jgi:hypothetical protein
MTTLVLGDFLLESLTPSVKCTLRSNSVKISLDLYIV